MVEELNAAKDSDFVEYPPVASVVIACAIESNIGIPAPHNINDHKTVNVIYTILIPAAKLAALGTTLSGVS